MGFNGTERSLNVEEYQAMVAQSPKPPRIQGHYSFDDANAYVSRWGDSFQRLEFVMRLKGHMAHADWWRLLGSQWTGFDNIVTFKSRLRDLLQRAKPAHLHKMMDDAERAHLTTLDNRITVYRGCYDNNRDGLSWTLSRDIAERITRLNRYGRTDEPRLILEGVAPKDRGVFKDDRNEQEIICPDVEVVAEDHLPPSYPVAATPGSARRS